MELLRFTKGGGLRVMQQYEQGINEILEVSNSEYSANDLCQLKRVNPETPK